MDKAQEVVTYSYENLLEICDKYDEERAKVLQYLLQTYKRLNSVLGYILEKEFSGVYVLTKEEFEYMSEHVWYFKNIINPDSVEIIESIKSKIDEELND